MDDASPFASAAARTDPVVLDRCGPPEMSA